MSSQGSVVPTSQRGSVPASGRGSTVLASCRGSVILVSHGSSVVPMSHGHSATPSSHGGSSPPSSHSRKAIQQIYPLSEEEDSQLPDHHYSCLCPPVGNDGFHFQSAQHSQTSGSIDLNIDEVSSSEDDRVAESLIGNNWQQESQSQKPQTSYKGVAPSPPIAPLQQDVPPCECSPAQVDIKDLMPTVSSGELGGPAMKLHSYPYKFHKIIE
ncbi:hypothetical protein EDC04DRAFT_2610908 [Pisolithus marmoratus]|nr:hypothetical protein EDC04DRAFT_2610908 [Pisolithus marmoratus]